MASPCNNLISLEQYLFELIAAVILEGWQSLSMPVASECFELGLYADKYVVPVGVAQNRNESRNGVDDRDWQLVWENCDNAVYFVGGSKLEMSYASPDFS